MAWEKWLSSGWRSWLRPVLVVYLLTGFTIFGPYVLPILSVDRTVAYFEKLPIRSAPVEVFEQGILPQHYADMFGWPEMVQAVAEAFNHLSAEEKQDCIIFVRNYGEAGAIDLWGAKYGLPKATCLHNAYWFWGPPNWNGKVGIILGSHRSLEENKASLRQRFESVSLGSQFSHPYRMPYENNLQFFICREATFDITRFWLQEKEFI